MKKYNTSFPLDIFNTLSPDLVLKKDNFINKEIYETKKKAIEGHANNNSSFLGSWGMSHYHRKIMYNPKKV